jgi:flagellin-like protein
MRKTNRKNKGVSTIIAAALLVAITVIIAVALGSTVLTAPTTEKPYQLQMSGSASIRDNEIRLTHLGGDPINTGSVTFKTRVPMGDYEDSVYEVSNEVPGYDEMWGIGGSTLEEQDWNMPMKLESDAWQMLVDWGEEKDPMYAGYYTWGYEYLVDTGDTGTYKAPVQAGDTLILNFEQSFGTGIYDNAQPSVGETFIVEVYYNGQPITSVSIIVQS